MAARPVAGVDAWAAPVFIGGVLGLFAAGVRMVGAVLGRGCAVATGGRDDALAALAPVRRNGGQAGRSALQPPLGRPSPQLVPPGRNVVLMMPEAVWVTSWPFSSRRRDWPEARVDSLFRNESDVLSSTLILEAVAATLDVWPEPPALGLVTY